jgi:hypothetical protein
MPLLQGVRPDRRHEVRGVHRDIEPGVLDPGVPDPGIPDEDSSQIASENRVAD